MLIIIMFIIPFLSADTFEGNAITTGSGYYSLKTIQVYPDQKIVVRVELSNPAIVEIHIGSIGSEIVLNRTVESSGEWEFISEVMGQFGIVIFSEGLSVEVDYSYIVSGIPRGYIKILIISIIFLLLSLVTRLSGDKNTELTALSVGNKMSLSDTVRSTMRIELDRSNAIALIIPILFVSSYVLNYSISFILIDISINFIRIYNPDIEFAYHFIDIIWLFLSTIIFGIPLILSQNIIDEFKGKSKHEQTLPINPKLVIITRSIVHFILIYPSVMIFIIFRILMMSARVGMEPNEPNLDMIYIVLFLSVIISYIFIMMINFTTWLFKSLQIPIYGVFILIIRRYYPQFLDFMYSFSQSDVAEESYLLYIQNEYISMFYVNRIIINVIVVSIVQFLFIVIIIGKLDRMRQRFENHQWILNKFNFAIKYLRIWLKKSKFNKLD